jgi:hypothetical protein
MHGEWYDDMALEAPRLNKVTSSPFDWTVLKENKYSLQSKISVNNLV